MTPRHPLRRGHRFHVHVRYAGVPVEFVLPGTDVRTGFMATSDGATVAGQPEVAASWYPVNDHPLDKAAYTFDVTVPQPYEVVANGFLTDLDRHRGSTTWTWDAREPMASYLATIDIGLWDVTAGGRRAGSRSMTRWTPRSPAACAPRSIPRSAGRVRSSTCCTTPEFIAHAERISGQQRLLKLLKSARL